MLKSVQNRMIVYDIPYRNRLHCAIFGQLKNQKII